MSTSAAELEGVRIGGELFIPDDGEGSIEAMLTEVERVGEDEVQITVTPVNGAGVTLKWTFAAARLIARQLLAATAEGEGEATEGNE